MKNKTLLIIAGIAVAGGAIWYMRKNAQNTMVMIPGKVQAKQPGADTQVINTTVSNDLLKPANNNTGIAPPSMATQPVIAQSSGLRPASILDRMREQQKRSSFIFPLRRSLNGTWLTSN